MQSGPSRLGKIESRFAPLPIDDRVARAYGELARHTVDAGRKVRTRAMDLLIAATARAHGLPLYTRNEEDFEPTRNLLDLRSA